MAELDRPGRAITVENDAVVEMRDGTRLRAEVYRPDQPGRFPVLLVRTPYGEQMSRLLPVLPALDAGFAVVIQYCPAAPAQQLAYRAGAGEDVTAEIPGLLGVLADLERAYQHLPLREMPAVHQIMPVWREWLAHEERGGYWGGLSYSAHRSRIKAPALHVGGWFDLFLGGTLDNFVTLSAGAATGHARRHQRLIIGPWTHTDQTGAAGELHFGAPASALAIQLEQTMLDFLGHFLREESTELPGPRVKLFVMGDNVWRDENEWPHRQAGRRVAGRPGDERDRRHRAGPPAAAPRGALAAPRTVVSGKAGRLDRDPWPAVPTWAGLAPMS